MSELPTRLRDAVSDPRAFIAKAQPRQLGLITDDNGRVAWAVQAGQRWTLPRVQYDAQNTGIVHYVTCEGFGERWDSQVVSVSDVPLKTTNWERPEIVLERWKSGEILVDTASRYVFEPVSYTHLTLPTIYSV